MLLIGHHWCYTRDIFYQEQDKDYFLVHLGYLYTKWLFSTLGASILGTLGNRTEWKHTMLAGLPFGLPRQTLCVCGGRVLLLLCLIIVNGCWSSVSLWIRKEIFASFYISGVSRVNVQRQVRFQGVWPGRCRFSRKPCPRAESKPQGAVDFGWSAVGSSARTAGAVWFGASLVWIYQGRDVSTVEELCSLKSVKRTFNFWALWLL